MNITVLGGTGYGGGAVVREAHRRGHHVTACSRHAATEPVDGVTYLIGSAVDPEFLAQAVEGADVVFEAIAPRGDMQGKLEPVVSQLIQLADRDSVRLGVLGGASSLLVAPGGPRLYDVTDFPDASRPEVDTGLTLLTMLKNSPSTLDWFYVSAAEGFGSWDPGTVTGRYRTSDDVLLTDSDGRSHISAADLALAVVDELERPQHHRQRFHVAH